MKNVLLVSYSIYMIQASEIIVSVKIVSEQKM